MFSLFLDFFQTQTKIIQKNLVKFHYKKTVKVTRQKIIKKPTPLSLISERKV